jgi:4-amino-4-deoxy-L-arabinose transferase-like glycosyltransferase
MNPETFAWGISSSRIRPQERWLELFYILGLFLLALGLYTINLGNVPLRDWDEGTIAQVAKEIYQSSFHSLKWLFPTLWGEPYLNKPSLIHSLIALVYSAFGISEFSTRIVGATLSACSIPLLYCLARELFIPRYYALFSALIYLTMLPVVRHGRLAMLDGAVVCFQILMIWCLLRSRRDLRWALGIGIAFGLICLTKGWMMGLLLGAIAFIFLIWDTPRLINSFYLWLGVFIGSLPVIMWQMGQWLYHGENFVNTSIFAQSLDRIYTSVEGHSGPIWYYVLELLKYAYPWLFLAFFGFKSAWKNRNWSWSKLILVWGLVYLTVVSLMQTKLPWYIMPIYPALALASGVALAKIKELPSKVSFPKSWSIFFGVLAGVIFLGGIYFAFWENEPQELLVIISLMCLTMAVTSFLIAKRDQLFIIVLFWGMYLSLMLFFSSNFWLWELNEAFPVKPVAEIIKNTVPSEDKVYISFPYERPSLNFYSEHPVISETTLQAQENKSLEDLWRENDHIYLVIDHKRLSNFNIDEFNCENYQFQSKFNNHKLWGDSQILDSYCLKNNQEPDWFLIYK